MPKNISAGKIARKIFNWFFILVILLIYATVLLQIFRGCDHAISETMLLDEQTRLIYERDPQELSIWEYNMTSSARMDERGKIQIQHVIYIEQTEQLQFTVKYNIEFFEGSFYRQSVYPIYYNVIKSSADSGQGLYPFEDMHIESAQRYTYAYLRTLCRGIKIQEGDDITLEVYTADGTHHCTVDLYNSQAYPVQLKASSLEYKNID